MLTLLVVTSRALSEEKCREAVSMIRLHGGEVVHRAAGGGLLLALFGTRSSPCADEAVEAAFTLQAKLNACAEGAFAAIITSVSGAPDPSVESLAEIPADLIAGLVRGASDLSRLSGILITGPTTSLLRTSWRLRLKVQARGVDLVEVLEDDRFGPLAHRNSLLETAAGEGGAATGRTGAPRRGVPIVTGAFRRMVERSPGHDAPAAAPIAQLNKVYASPLDAMRSGGLPPAVFKPGPVSDLVACTVFAPPSVPAGGAVLVQVFAHPPDRAGDAAALAAELDGAAVRRAFRSLETEVARGQWISIALEVPGAVVDEPIASLRWLGDPEAVQFGVSVAPTARAGTLIGTLTVSLSSVPIGHLKFRLEVTAQGTPLAAAEPAGEAARCYTAAFISYASADRDRVLARVQMLAPLGIRFFQDVVDLTPGQRWERELYHRIDECDLFLLFWSRAALDSEWVLREARYALERQGRTPQGLPAIVPVILEGPPVVPPPSELAHLHFNDRLLYFMTATERGPG